MLVQEIIAVVIEEGVNQIEESQKRLADGRDI